MGVPAPEIPGSMLLDSTVLDDPYPFYQRLHEEAPVWRVPGTDVFVVSSFELVCDATARVDDFSSHMRALLYRDNEGLPGRLEFGGEGTDALATADPPVHKMHRDVVFSELVAKRMATLEEPIAELADVRIDGAIAKGTVDFMADVGNIVPITVISWLIGFRASDPERLLEAAFDSTSLVGGNVSLGQLEGLVVRSGEIGAWIADQLAGSIETPTDDILGAIARGVSSRSMTHREGVVVLQTLLSAGGESTTSLLGNAVRYLAEHQDMQDQLRAEPELLQIFIEEMLRLESPFRFLLRSAPATTSLGGVEIPAGSSFGQPPTETAQPSRSPTRSISKGPCLAATWRSVVASITVSVRLWHAWRHESCLVCCCRRRSPSPWTENTDRCGSRACRSVATASSRCSSRRAEQLHPT